MKSIKGIIASFLCLALIMSTLTLNTEMVEAASSSTPKLSSKKVTLYVGQTKTVKVKNTTGTVKWTTKNKKIATVSSKGKIKAKKQGKTTVTARCGKTTLICKVTVKKVSLNRTKLTLTEGKTANLKLQGSEVKKWSSSNNSIATVSKKGKVTAKKAGTVKIKAKTANKKTYTCKVTVKAKTTPTPTPSNTVTPTPSNTVTPTPTVEPTVTPTNSPTPTPHTVHEYTSYTIVKAGCEHSGLIEYQCKYCDYHYTESPEALGHKWSDVKTKESTCIEVGYKYIECERCSEISKLADLELAEHDYQTYVITEPTCTSGGSSEVRCSVCSAYQRYIYVPMLAHKYAATIVEPTCTSDGYTYHECSVCGIHYNSDTVSKIDHVYKSTVVKPGRNTTGYTLHTCSGCGDTYKSDPVVATDLQYFTYTLDETNKTITLTNISTADAAPSDIVIYPYYEIGYEKYSTVINMTVGSYYSYNGSNSAYSKFTSVTVKGGTLKYFKVQDCSNVTKIEIQEGTNTTQLTDAYYMFFNLSKLTELDLSGLDTSNITDMSYMFYGCGALEEIDLSKFNTRSVKTMQGMFSGCTSLKSVDLSSSLGGTSNLTNTSYMFTSCKNLKTINLSKFTNVSKLNNISSMFNKCTSTTDIKISAAFKNKIKAQLQNKYSATNENYVNTSNYNTDCAFDIEALILE